MNSTAVVAAVTKHIPVKLKDGTRTSVSIPTAYYAECERRLGGDGAALRAALREAVLTAKPRLGVTRSQAVRFALEAKIEQLTTKSAPSRW